MYVCVRVCAQSSSFIDWGSLRSVNQSAAEADRRCSPVWVQQSAFTLPTHFRATWGVIHKSELLELLHLLPSRRCRGGDPAPSWLQPLNSRPITFDPHLCSAPGSIDRVSSCCLLKFFPKSTPQPPPPPTPSPTSHLIMFLWECGATADFQGCLWDPDWRCWWNSNSDDSPF